MAAAVVSLSLDSDPPSYGDGRFPCGRRRERDDQLQVLALPFFLAEGPKSQHLDGDHAAVGLQMVSAEMGRGVEGG